MNSVLKGPTDDVRSHPGRVETHHPPTHPHVPMGAPNQGWRCAPPTEDLMVCPIPPNTKDPEVCPVTPPLRAPRSGPCPAHPHEGSEVLWAPLSPQLRALREHSANHAASGPEAGRSQRSLLNDTGVHGLDVTGGGSSQHGPSFIFRPNPQVHKT